MNGSRLCPRANEKWISDNPLRHASSPKGLSFPLLHFNNKCLIYPNLKPHRSLARLPTITTTTITNTVQDFLLPPTQHVKRLVLTMGWWETHLIININGTRWSGNDDSGGRFYLVTQSYSITTRLMNSGF